MKISIEKKYFTQILKDFSRSNLIFILFCPTDKNRISFIYREIA
ncbi:hypothetical protein NU08_3665 [Flavobacterium anhuiense]|uniref:Uncharacterized protein n=1 Tax=Flavobacterium anhuiense TaxID=459526 RepID=A0A444VUE8_9FLAO|nr:hypothetical protein NU08_3665 [Flavobacterium anhuiense]